MQWSLQAGLLSLSLHGSTLESDLKSAAGAELSSTFADGVVSVDTHSASALPTALAAHILMLIFKALYGQGPAYLQDPARSARQSYSSESLVEVPTSILPSLASPTDGTRTSTHSMVSAVPLSLECIRDTF